jgi:inhibitor of cysteine peptidase
MPELIITSADEGVSHDAEVGQIASLQLEENPSTGYRWAMEISPREAVELLESRWLRGDSKGVGAAGMREIRVRFTSRGEVHIHLKLWRAWEGEGSVMRRHEFTFRVR